MKKAVFYVLTIAACRASDCDLNTVFIRSALVNTNSKVIKIEYPILQQTTEESAEKNLAHTKKDSQKTVKASLQSNKLTEN